MKATIDRNDTTATVPGTARPRTKMSSLEESLKWWSGWSDWLGIAAVAVGALLTFLTAVGWGVSWKAGKLKDDALEKFKIESNARISEADSKAAEANNAAAAANERAALLERETAVARLELEQIKEKQRPRSMSRKQRTAFIEALSKVPARPVRVIYFSNEQEAIKWAEDVREALNAAGFADPAKKLAEYHLGGLNSHSGHTTSIAFHTAEEAMRDRKYALTIQRAFAEAEISADLTTLPQVIQPGEIGILIIDK